MSLDGTGRLRAQKYRRVKVSDVRFQGASHLSGPGLRQVEREVEIGDLQGIESGIRLLLRGDDLPTVSRFFGIEIRMYYEDHEPPHFHAHYADTSAVIAIESLAALRSDLPRRAYRMILEWAIEHRPELRENWQRARDHEPLTRIEPLR